VGVALMVNLSDLNGRLSPIKLPCLGFPQIERRVLLPVKSGIKKIPKKGESIHE